MCERGRVRALFHAGSLRMHRSRFMAAPSRVLYRHRAASKCARTWRSWLQSTWRGSSRRKVGVFARFMTCFAFRCRVSLQKETELLPVPRVFLHFHMPTQLFQLGRLLLVTRRRTVRKSIREKQLRASKLGRRGGYHIRRSDLHEFLRKRETIKVDELS